MPEPLLTPLEAAAYLRLALHTLENWRWRGAGPAYLRYGRRIRYRRADLEAWLEAHTHRPEEAVARSPAPLPGTLRPLRLLPER